MKRVLLQGIGIIVLFFSTWGLLGLFDWMEIFKVEKMSRDTEEKLGELFWDFFKNSEDELDNEIVFSAIDSLIIKICTENKIERSKIKLHILDKDEVNAFALPDGHLVIFTGLILETANEEELAGVLGHELAHIQSNHVMKKLVKEVGLSVLISITTGNTGADAIKEMVRMLSSTAFDRQLESEADIKSVDYLINAKIDPRPFGDFLYKLSDADSELLKYLNWVSTHPDSKERAEEIVNYCSDKEIESVPVLSQETWSKVKGLLQAN